MKPAPPFRHRLLGKGFAYFNEHLDMGTTCARANPISPAVFLFRRSLSLSLSLSLSPLSLIHLNQLADNLRQKSPTSTYWAHSMLSRKGQRRSTCMTCLRLKQSRWYMLHGCMLGLLSGAAILTISLYLYVQANQERPTSAPGMVTIGFLFCNHRGL